MRVEQARIARPADQLAGARVRGQLRDRGEELPQLVLGIDIGEDHLDAHAGALERALRADQSLGRV